MCPTCKGRKTINDPKYLGKMMGYIDRDGNRCPQIECISCGGVGHVLQDGNHYVRDNDAVNARDAAQIGKEQVPSYREKKEPTLAELEQQLRDALKEEDYDRCAKLRDEIARRRR